MWRVGIDVGGTFTDLYAVDSDSGSARTGKVLTTPKDRVLGVISAISEAGLSPEDIDLLVHGTTTGTNALIERSFPPAAMITPKGFATCLRSVACTGSICTDRTRPSRSLLSGVETGSCWRSGSMRRALSRFQLIR